MQAARRSVPQMRLPASMNGRAHAFAGGADLMRERFTLRTENCSSSSSRACRTAAGAAHQWSV